MNDDLLKNLSRGWAQISEKKGLTREIWRQARIYFTSTFSAAYLKELSITSSSERLSLNQ